VVLQDHQGREESWASEETGLNVVSKVAEGFGSKPALDEESEAEAALCVEEM